jgi:hypothetical protein
MPKRRPTRDKPPDCRPDRARHRVRARRTRRASRTLSLARCQAKGRRSISPGGANDLAHQGVLSSTSMPAAPKMPPPGRKRIRGASRRQAHAMSNRFQLRPPFAGKDDPGAETGGVEPHIAEQSPSWRAAARRLRGDHEGSTDTWRKIPPKRVPGPVPRIQAAAFALLVRGEPRSGF